MDIFDKAPDFSLKDKDGKLARLSDLEGVVVLYFYPKDDTPGCTIQAKEYSAHLNEFKRGGITVLGISGGDEKSKQKFCDKYGLKVRLLSDSDFSVCKKYGVYGEKKFMGKLFKGIRRTSFIIKDGLIKYVIRSVDVKNDYKEVLDKINELGL